MQITTKVLGAGVDSVHVVYSGQDEVKRFPVMLYDNARAEAEKLANALRVAG
tara:strand:- start:25277 stop:25432 length:156 start_codon:yes stop_codon:yes gene_type:complete